MIMPLDFRTLNVVSFVGVQSFQEGPPVAWQPLVLPDSIVIALIAAVAFLICVAITTIGAVLYKR